MKHYRFAYRSSGWVIAIGIAYLVAGTPAASAGFIQKRGYLNSPILEVTPLVWQGDLYLLENWRGDFSWPGEPGGGVASENSQVWLAQMVGGPGDYAARQYVSMPFDQHGLSTALVWNDRAYVFGVNELTGRQQINLTWSDDLVNWSTPQTVFNSPGGLVYNVAVTPDDTGFAFLWETDNPGTPFTMHYGHVDNLTDDWNPGILTNAIYGADKYTGGPALYYEGGWYYTLYLHHLGGGDRYETRITRSQDLVNWEDAPAWRTFVGFDPSHVGLPLNPAAVESNASDAELTYYNNQTVIYFSGGDQRTSGDLQWATAAATPRQLFESFFLPPQNLSDRAGVLASATSYVKDGVTSDTFAPGRAIDGDVDTYWHAAGDLAGAYRLIVDLKQAMAIDGVEIDKRGTDAYVYTIKVSEDGLNWTQLLTAATAGDASDLAGADPLAHGFETILARYVLFETDFGDVALNEFRVYAAVPEPGAFALFLAAAVWGCGRRCRCRRRG